MSSGSPGVKYFLYIPVWATTQQPPGSSVSSQSTEASSSSSSSESTEASSSETEGSSSGGGGSSSGGGGSSSGGGTGPGGTGPGGTGPGGTGPGGTGPGGTGPGGTGPGGTEPSGGSSNCLLYGTLITLADGRRVPIEMVRPGDEVQSLVVPGLKTDVPFKAQYEWLSTWGLEGASMRAARVAQISIGEHDAFFIINRRIKATFEHPFLVRRGDAWGFCSAELLQVGDHLITPVAGGLGEERVETLDRIDGRVRTVAIRVPGTNTYLAEGVWTHNDTEPTISVSNTQLSHSSSSSGSSSSGSSSGSKSSGSSFSSSSSSGSIILTGVTNSTGSTHSGSGTGFTHQSSSGGGETFGNSAGSSGNTFGDHKG